MINKEDMTGLVLAGGRGSRMGYVDKGLQQLQGLCLVQHAIARLETQVQRILISANQNQQVYREFGHTLVHDANQNFDGPLAGVLSAWDSCRTDYMLSVPCDAPHFPLDLAQRLAQVFSEQQNHASEQTTTTTIAAVIAATKLPRSHYAEEIRNVPNSKLNSTELNVEIREQPVFCLMHRSAKNKLAEFLEQGGRKLTDFFQFIETRRVIFDNADAFLNLNTLDQLDKLNRDQPSPSTCK